MGFVSHLLPVLLAVGVNNALASPVSHARSEYAVKETHFVPRGWERVGEAPATQSVTLQLALKQSQFDELERNLYEGRANSHV